MKDFYMNRLGLDLFSEEEGRHVFLKAGKNMLYSILKILEFQKITSFQPMVL
jgi:hypothetical protein